MMGGRQLCFPLGVSLIIKPLMIREEDANNKIIPSLRDEVSNYSQLFSRPLPYAIERRLIKAEDGHGLEPATTTSWAGDGKHKDELHGIIQSFRLTQQATSRQTRTARSRGTEN